jgi:hypothetical protein
MGKHERETVISPSFTSGMFFIISSPQSPQYYRHSARLIPRGSKPAGMMGAYWYYISIEAHNQGRLSFFRQCFFFFTSAPASGIAHRFFHFVNKVCFLYTLSRYF